MINPILWPDWPVPERVNALTTTRVEGVSRYPFDSCNLALNVGDDRAHVLSNRLWLRKRLQLLDEPKWLQQVHSNKVVDAATINPDAVEADAAYTTAKGVVCAVLTADCLPILFADQEGSCVGVAHAGWRGLLGGVIENTVQAMSTYARPKVAWLGPAIGPQAFEVGADVYSAYLEQRSEFEKAFTESGSDSWQMNIYEAAKIVLASADISNVYGGNLCTYTDHEKFYSFRRNAATGRMATLIWLD